MSAAGVRADGSPSEIRRHWRLLLAATVAVGLGMPTILFFSIGIFAPILATEFGWPQRAIMGGLMMTAVLILILGPVAGRIVDQRGAREIAAISLVGLGLSYMSFALTTGSLAQYYLSWLCFALFGMGATAISFTHAIAQNFSRQRGLALGIALAGSGLYGMLVKFYAAWAIPLLGWRMTIVTVGLLPIFIAAPLVLWGFPRRRASTSPASARKPAQPVPPPGLRAREAFGGRAFWLIFLAFVPIAMANGAPIPNIETILASLQIAPAQIVHISALIGLSLLLGRVIGGYLIDHFWAPAVAAVLLALAATGCAILTQEGVVLWQAAIAAGLLGIAAGVEYDLLAFLIARYIGLRSYGTVYSVLFGAFAIGAGSGPALLGATYDHFGSYATGLAGCAVALVLAAVPLLMLGRYPRLEAAPARSDSRTPSPDSFHVRQRSVSNETS